MRKIAVITCLFLSISFGFSQSSFDKFALELSTGVAGPVTPKDQIVPSKYTSLNSFKIAGRYTFDSYEYKNLYYLSARLSYSYHGFKNSDNSDLGIIYHKITGEAVYNLGKRLNLNYLFYENFGLLTSLGAGMSFASPVDANFYEKIGHIQLGLTPQIKISESFSAFLDLTYILNLKQHYYYNGDLIDTNYEHVTGGYGTLTIGLTYYIGNKNIHADWY